MRWELFRILRPAKYSTEATHHHVLKLSVELLKLGGQFLPKNSRKNHNNANNDTTGRQQPSAAETRFTSHVWLNLLTAGLLIPIMMAKKEFKFLNSRQLRTDTQSQLKAPTCCVCVRVCVHGVGHSLRCDLDELLEELHSLAELRAQTHLGHHPQLHLVEPAQEQVQVGRRPAEVLPPERVVQQLVLKDGGGGGTR